MDSQTRVKSRLDHLGWEPTMDYICRTALINRQHYTKWNLTYSKFFLPSTSPENANDYEMIHRT